LIVELDGGQHACSTTADDRRTKWLSQNGWRVIRFWNNEVIENLSGVQETIAAALVSSNARPHPGPLPHTGEADT